MNHTAPNTAAKRSAQQLRDLPLTRLKANLNHRIATAHLLEGDAHLIALDANARLITELRILYRTHGENLF